MDPAGIPALVEAIRHMHGCAATHVATEHVHEKAPTGETVWSGDVEVFAIAGHPKASRAYAWSEATTGTKRRFFAVLHVEPVTGAATAVRASIMADVRSR
jgi:hypothetical protein